MLDLNTFAFTYPTGSNGHDQQFHYVARKPPPPGALQTADSGRRDPDHRDVATGHRGRGSAGQGGGRRHYLPHRAWGDLWLGAADVAGGADCPWLFRGY